MRKYKNEEMNLKKTKVELAFIHFSLGLKFNAVYTDQNCFMFFYLSKNLSSSYLSQQHPGMKGDNSGPNNLGGPPSRPKNKDMIGAKIGK